MYIYLLLNYDDLVETIEYITPKGTVIRYVKNVHGEPYAKHCTRCDVLKPFAAFRSLKLSTFDLYNECRECMKVSDKEKRRKAGCPPLTPELLFLDENKQIPARVCLACKYTKNLEAFDLAPHGFMGRTAKCKECTRRKAELRRRGKGVLPPKQINTQANEVGEVTHRQCCRCLQMTPLALFNKHKNAKLGVHPYCKSCSSERFLVAKYGITLAEKKALYDGQGRKCAICHVGMELNNLKIDHCHKTGKVRGLLCDPCNISLGFMEEDVGRCERMIEYIKATR